MTRHGGASALCAVAGAALLLSACAAGGTLTPATPVPPPVAREFRGVWVATVGNIDWPSRPGLPADSQQAELVAILDRAVELRLNAVIFQVRTAADALYASELEPWSEYLSGTMGQPPAPYYDPLAFAVAEAHRRGLELHAWFNPYRARHPSSQSPVAATHVSVTKPGLVRTYGTHLWLDPGDPAVQDHSIAVLLDVLRRYDVDGIHIDDYFYPYRERDPAGNEIPFPDDATWARYQASGGTLSRSDWRRRNVDEFVRRLDREVHRVKPWVRFGVSPIGIWRPGHPAEGCCFDAYESIFADARKWLAAGWLDYFVPQLYRSMADTSMNYGIMLGWWGEQNLKRRHVYVGMIPNRLGPEEIVGQIYVARGHPAAQGHVHFSARTLMRNDTLNQRLLRSVYRTPALVPVSEWLPTRTPARPRGTLAPAGPERATLVLEPAEATTRLWQVRWRVGERWHVRLVPAGERRIELEGGGAVTEVRVSAVDRTGRESEALVLRPGG